VTKAAGTKADRKASAAAMQDKGAYVDTVFGRRRVSRMSRWLGALIRLIGKPIWFIKSLRSNDNFGL
jgi:hypothetical protein